MLLLELFEAGQEPRPLATGDRHLGRLQEPAQLGPGGIDDRGRQHPAGHGGQDVVLDEIGRTATCAAAERRAAIVAPFGAALEMGLPAHPGAARAVEQAAQQVVAERSRLVADASTGGDGGRGPAVLRLGEDWLVPALTLVVSALLGHVTEVEAAPPPDVLDRVPCPARAVRDPFAVHQVGHRDERSLRQLVPHPADDRGLLGYDDQLARMEETPGGVAPAVVAEGIVAAMAAVLEQASLHAGHPLARLRVQIHSALH